MNDKTAPTQRLLAVIALMTLVTAFGLAIAWYTNSTRANGVDCSGDWSRSSDVSLVNACGKQKGIAVATEIAADFATMNTQPWIKTDPGFTPGPNLPEPAALKEVAASPWGNNPNPSLPPIQFAGASTVWRDGAVPDDKYTIWAELFVLTMPGNGASYDSLSPVQGVITVTTNPTLKTIVFGGIGDSSMEKYDKVWTDPQPDGALYITKVTNPDFTSTDPKTPYPGLRSVVYFTTKSGQTGHFDMTTEKWTFDVMSGTVVAPTPPLPYP